MSARLKATFFCAGNPEGRRLRDAFVGTLGQVYDLKTEVVEGGTQAELNRSCVRDDLVIFDASVEEGHNYAAATAQPMTMDHVLVVSRTYLPLNFYGLREGGAPDFPARTRQSNEEILGWLRRHVGELAARPARPDDRKGFIGSMRTMRESVRKREASWKARGRVFISYRSRHVEAVRQLKRRVERGDFQGGRRTTAFFLTPGELVYEDEILTEQRCWQLASMIDRRVGAADELWVYETDDYYDSWWTRAELMTVAYRRASGADVPLVRLFDPERGVVRDAPADFLPAMNRGQVRRMARWYANTDPGTMGPEALTPMRFYSQVPLLGRLAYFHDHVWSDDFWFVPILPCEQCEARGARPALRDVESFLWLNQPKFVRLQPQQLEEALGRGEFVCTGCRIVYKIRKDPHPRYLWMPVRAGRATGPDGTHLLELPIYRVRR